MQDRRSGDGPPRDRPWRNAFRPGDPPRSSARRLPKSVSNQGGMHDSDLPPRLRHAAQFHLLDRGTILTLRYPMIRTRALRHYSVRVVSSRMPDTLFGFASHSCPLAIVMSGCPIACGDRVLRLRCR